MHCQQKLKAKEISGNLFCRKIFLSLTHLLPITRLILIFLIVWGAFVLQNSRCWSLSYSQILPYMHIMELLGINIKVLEVKLNPHEPCSCKIDNEILCQGGYFIHFHGRRSWKISLRNYISATQSSPHFETEHLCDFSCCQSEKLPFLSVRKVVIYSSIKNVFIEWHSRK